MGVGIGAEGIQLTGACCFTKSVSGAFEGSKLEEKINRVRALRVGAWQGNLSKEAIEGLERLNIGILGL